MVRLLVLAAALGGMLLVACAAQPAEESAAENPAAIHPDPRLAELTDFIRSSFEDWNVPGLAVAVVSDDRLVFAEGFGVKQLGRSEPIDAQTLFQVGSVTKTFGAAAIAALVDDELASFDDHLIEHLPWFELSEPERAKSITLRDLARHTSGVPEDYYPALEVIDARTTAERVARLNNFSPHGEYRYSNLGYGLLGLVVESASGQPWGDWITGRLLEPLGMTNTYPSPNRVWEPQFVAPTFLGTATAGSVTIDQAPGQNVAMPHGFDIEGNRRILAWQSYDNMQAAGSVVSNVVDMSRWLRFHLNRGALDGKTVSSQSVISEMHTAQVEAQGYFLFDDDPASAYGLGWEIESFGGQRYLSHGGGIFGFPAYVALLPDANAGVVVLVNGSLWTPYYPHQEIAAFVFSRLLELPERDFHAEAMAQTRAIEKQVEQALAAQEETRRPDAQASIAEKDLVGNYANEYQEKISIAAIDGLRLSFSSEGSFSGKLEPWNGDTYRLLYDGGDGQAFSRSFATFTVLEGGSVINVDLGNLGAYRRPIQ